MVYAAEARWHNTDILHNGAEPAASADRAGITAFGGVQSIRPARSAERGRSAFGTKTLFRRGQDHAGTSFDGTADGCADAVRRPGFTRTHGRRSSAVTATPW